MADIINLKVHRNKRGLEHRPSVSGELGEIFVTRGDQHEYPFRAHEIPDAVKYFVEQSESFENLSIRFGELTLLFQGEVFVPHGAYHAPAAPRTFLPPEIRVVIPTRTDVLQALLRWAHDSELQCLAFQSGMLLLWKVPMDLRRFRFGYCWV